MFLFSQSNFLFGSSIKANPIKGPCNQVRNHGVGWRIPVPAALHTDDGFLRKVKGPRRSVQMPDTSEPDKFDNLSQCPYFLILRCVLSLLKVIRFSIVLLVFCSPIVFYGLISLIIVESVAEVLCVTRQAKYCPARQSTVQTPHDNPTPDLPSLNSGKFEFGEL